MATAPGRRVAARVVSPRAWVEIGLVVVAALIGWLYLHQRDERLRAEGRLELELARADSTARAAADLVRESEARDSAAALVVRQAEAARAAAEARAAELTARAPAAADRVVAAAAPTDSAAVRARLDELVALYEQRDTERLRQIRADSMIIAELRALDVTRVAAIASLESALAAAQAATETALDSRPGWLERNLPRVGIVAGAVGGWLLRGALGG